MYDIGSGTWLVWILSWFCSSSFHSIAVQCKILSTHKNCSRKNQSYKRKKDDGTPIWDIIEFLFNPCEIYGISYWCSRSAKLSKSKAGYRSCIGIDYISLRWSHHGWALIQKIYHCQNVRFSKNSQRTVRRVSGSDEGIDLKFDYKIG